MSLSETVKKLLINIAVHFSIVLIFGILINAYIKFDTQAAFIKGLVLSAALSAVKVILMERGISKSLSMKSSYAGIYALLQITMRNMLTAGLITSAILINSISIWGVLAGLTLLQTAAFSVPRSRSEVQSVQVNARNSKLNNN